MRGCRNATGRMSGFDPLRTFGVRQPCTIRGRSVRADRLAKTSSSNLKTAETSLAALLLSRIAERPIFLFDARSQS